MKSGRFSGLMRGAGQGVPVDMQRMRLLKPGLPPQQPGQVYGGNTLWDAAAVRPAPSMGLQMPASAQRYLDRANGVRYGLGDRAAMIGNTLEDFIMRLRGGY